MPCELKGSRGLGISKRVVLVLEKAFLSALLDLYHPNDIFLVPARSAREAAVPQRAGYRRLLSIQCTRTVCWSSLADCSDCEFCGRFVAWEAPFEGETRRLGEEEEEESLFRG
jgi:hypothetical protein